MAWSVSEWVRGILVACMLAAMFLGLPRWLAQWEQRRGEKAPDAPPMPHWSGITSYTELADTAVKSFDRLTPAAFLDGPFRQFLRMGCSDRHPRVRARIMEFGRGTLEAYCRHLGERGGNPAEFRARARAMAAEWFGRPEVQAGDYMLEVLDGISNHNWRGTLG